LAPENGLDPEVSAHVGHPALRVDLLAAAFLVVAFNLRPAIAAVSPLLGTIRRSADLSPVAGGLLTTLPLLCFGSLAFAAPWLVRRYGAGLLLFACLLVLTAAIALRSAPSNAALFAGTIAIGVSIGTANVLMPGLVKKDFPARIGVMTGLYTMFLSVGPALAALLSVPLYRVFDGSWRLAIGFWALPAALATILWLPFRRHDRPSGPRPDPVGATYPKTLIGWRDPVAVSVTMYMGLQSLAFYTVLAWLPTILHSRGTSVYASGLLLFLVNAVGIVSALVAPVLANRMTDQRLAVVVSSATMACGLAGLTFYANHLDVVWCVLLGIGIGSAISLALMMMVLRARDIRQANALSGRAQGFGYLIAAAGPAVAGALYGATGGWRAPLLLLLALMVPQALAGWRGGHGTLRTLEPTVSA
jgi:MFS transporter, CP family, cyanate transporter